MKLVVFSDIHGNSYALKTFLKKIKKIQYDYVIFCGDIFGYYYNQREVIEQLQSINDLIWLKGNHDEYFLQLLKHKMDKTFLVQKYGHSYSLATGRDKQKFANQIKSHNPSFELYTLKERIGIFHGTPENPLEGRLYPDNMIENPAEYETYDFVILGHTHCRMQRYVGNTLVVNPGSLGQPRDGNGYSYAIVDTVDKSVQFENVEYNVDALYRQIDRYDPELYKLKEVLERRN